MIPLAEPFITQLEKDHVLDALESGWINTTGPYIDKLETLLANATKTQYTVTLANGTSALFLALKALGIGPGSKVAVPSITFVATINAVIYTGAEPIFFDCGDDLNIDPEEIQDYLYLQQDLDCIIPVHIFGNPCNMDRINEIAQKYNIKVIEDACEALGSVYENRPCGSLSDIGTFSFSFNKMITSGNGGAVVTNNKEWADRIRYWSHQAKDDPINYIHNEVGYNLGLTNIHAALGYGQLRRLEYQLYNKNRILKLYRELLGEGVVHTPGSNCWFIGYITENRDKIAHTLAQNKVQTRPIWKPNHLQKPFIHYTRYSSSLNNKLSKSEYYGKAVINLPCSVNLRETDITKICDIIKEVERN